MLLKQLYAEGIKSCFLYADRDWPIAKHILYRYLNSFHMNAYEEQGSSDKLRLNIAMSTPLLNTILDICIKANQVKEALGDINGSHDESVEYNKISESTKPLISYISNILYSSKTSLTETDEKKVNSDEDNASNIKACK